MTLFRQPWVLFGICVLITLLALGWLSAMLLQLDQSSASARRKALLEETTRLALWRLDSRMASIIAAENARYPYEYDAFFPLESTYTRMLTQISRGEILVPSPLLTLDNHYIKLHFQYDQSGKLSSPQVPEGNMRDLAEAAYVQHEDITRRETDLNRMKQWVSYEKLNDGLQRADRMSPGTGIQFEHGHTGETPAAVLPEQSTLSQVQLNTREYEARRKHFKEGAALGGRVAAEKTELMADFEFSSADASRDPESGFQTGRFYPFWIDDELVFARKVVLNGTERLQAIWMNWTTLRHMLLKDIEDLLPNARLHPDSRTGGIMDLRRTASVPVLLDPGQPAFAVVDEWSAVQISLVITWFCVFGAVAASAVLLRGVLSLSERRAAFVSAVTHELRTPLTTFRMYTEMLAGGMASRLETQREYIDILHTEAERLTHLVENVLVFSRLEKASAGYQLEPVDLETLLQNITPRLQDRADQAGMTLLRQPVGDTVHVQADQAAVERILFNLVDNACKYASGDRRILIKTGCSRTHCRIHVRDFGPGIPVQKRKKLFTAFNKSAREAAGNAPGVGLGLALSRKLARKMGGNLYYDESVTGGAAFVILLKKVSG
jgi:signal transduction histidine kinase